MKQLLKELEANKEDSKCMSQCELTTTHSETMAKRLWPVLQGEVPKTWMGNSLLGLSNRWASQQVRKSSRAQGEGVDWAALVIRPLLVMLDKRCQSRLPWVRANMIFSGPLGERFPVFTVWDGYLVLLATILQSQYDVLEAECAVQSVAMHATHWYSVKLSLTSNITQCLLANKAVLAVLVMSLSAPDTVCWPALSLFQMHSWEAVWGLQPQTPYGWGLRASRRQGEELLLSLCLPQWRIWRRRVELPQKLAAIYPRRASQT